MTTTAIEIVRTCVSQSAPPQALLALSLRLLHRLLPHAPTAAVASASAAALFIELLATDAPPMTAAAAPDVANLADPNADVSTAADTAAARAASAPNSASLPTALPLHAGGRARVAAEDDSMLEPYISRERLRVCVALLVHGGEGLRAGVAARLAEQPWACGLCARALLGRLRLGLRAAREPTDAAAILTEFGGGGGWVDEVVDDDDAIVVLASRRVHVTLGAPPDSSASRAAELAIADESGTKLAARAVMVAVVPLALGLCEALGAHDMQLRRAVEWQLAGGAAGIPVALMPHLAVPPLPPPAPPLQRTSPEKETEAPDAAAAVPSNVATPNLAITLLGVTVELPSVAWDAVLLARERLQLITRNCVASPEVRAIMPQWSTLLSCMIVLLLGGALPLL